MRRIIFLLILIFTANSCGKNKSKSIDLNESEISYSKEELSDKFKYDLIDFDTKNKFKLESEDVVFHLIKEDQLAVLYNDKKYPIEILKTIDFSNSEVAVLLLDKRLTTQDLFKVYYWLEFKTLKNIKLITKKSEGNYYQLKDEIIINDPLFRKFREFNKLPPIFKKLENKEYFKIEYSDFNFENLDKETNYLIQITEKIDLKDYLKLREKVNRNKNLQIEIKTAYNKELS
ncbi:hypothetical protein [Aureivirga sp. CE67]|uniref:hypothetical protein n=1 Tax=Aureivirga sp. CE67 TaxID=1788983 RepID=UPI0018CB4F68|nr:hypothetical protein [Aureivirga sp. CE67]